MFVYEVGVSFGNIMFSNYILFVSVNTVPRLLKNPKGGKITKAAFFGHSLHALRRASHPLEN